MLPSSLCREAACCHKMTYYDHMKTLPEKEAIVFMKKVHSNTLLARNPVFKCLANQHIKPLCKM
jgi:hypothetical protein